MTRMKHLSMHAWYCNSDTLKHWNNHCQSMVQNRFRPWSRLEPPKRLPTPIVAGRPDRHTGPELGRVPAGANTFEDGLFTPNAADILHKRSSRELHFGPCSVGERNLKLFLSLLNPPPNPPSVLVFIEFSAQPTMCSFLYRILRPIHHLFFSL